jgi:hypothetical protein
MNTWLILIALSLGSCSVAHPTCFVFSVHGAKLTWLKVFVCILDIFAFKRLLFVFLPVPQAIDSRAFHFAAGFIHPCRFLLVAILFPN